MMVNNGVNINKTNNQSSHSVIDHKKTMIYGVGNPGHGFGERKNEGDGISTLPS